MAAAKRPAPSNARLSSKLSGLLCAPFDAGYLGGSPELRPTRKRSRVPAPLPALSDTPCLDPGAASDSSCGPALGGPSEWLLEPRRPPAAPGEALSERGADDALAHGGGHGQSSSGDWRMVLYHDRHVVMYNPQEQPPFRSRKVPASDDGAATSAVSMPHGRCPLCRQNIDSRFAFAAQAYFDLLQGAFRNARNAPSGETDPSEEVDVLLEGDLYRILGVTRMAGPDDIKRAYRRRSLRYHPDKNPDDRDAKLKFQKVAEAFSVLSDEAKRAKYDSSGDMDLDDFDVEQFMEMVKTSGLKFQKSPFDVDAEDMDEGPTADTTWAISDSASNPFLAPAEEEVMPAVIASEGGAQAEAEAAAALRNVPPGLLNTGYYSRFFNETKKLGSGSWGSVFLCRHVLDDLTLGDYAVKKVPVGDNKAWLRDMVREVKTFERLHHPNVVEYKHSWLELSRSSLFCPLVPFLFILMQYCNGGSLDELVFYDGSPLRPRAPLSMEWIWHLLLDILLGLQHLHGQGILHRDLKPTNILLQWPETPSGRSREGIPSALLSDFGTAAPFGEAPIGATASRGYTGTVEYTAPELLHGGHREYTEKSDMWSLGIVLYAMCHSSLPFVNDDPSALKSLICSFVEERSAPQASTPSAAEDAGAWLPPDEGGRLGPLRLVLAALLAFDPARRPSATDLLENPTFRGQAARHTRRGDPAR